MPTSARLTGCAWSESVAAVIKALIAGAVAVLLGLVILSLDRAPTKWIIGCIGLFGLGNLIMFSKDRERLLLVILFMTFPLPIANFFGQLSIVHRGGPPGYFILLSDLPLLALYGLWLPKLLSKSVRPIRISGAAWCLIGVIMMSILSMANAVDIRFCLYELTRLVILLLLYLYMANAPGPVQQARLMLMIAMLGLLAEGALGIFQVISGRAVGLRLTGGGVRMEQFSGLLRAGGTLGHPNTFAIYLGLLLPVALSLFASSRKFPIKLIDAAAFFFGFAAIILTLSRGGWSGLFISFIIWICIALRFRLVQKGKLAAAVGISLALLFALFMMFREPIEIRLFADDYGSAYSRIPLMKIALNMIRSHPFVGIGLNNYLLVMSHYDNTPEGISFSFYNVVHNGYLLLASQIGILGLIGFLGVVACTFMRAWQFLKCSQDSVHRLLVAGMLAGFAGVLWQMLVENIYLTYHSMLQFWAMAGLIEGLASEQARYLRPVERCAGSISTAVAAS